MQITSIEQSYNAIIDTIGQAGLGVIIVQNNKDNIATIVFCNDRSLAMLGYTRKEIIGKPIWDIIAEEDLQKVKENYRDRQAGSKVPSQYEATMIMKDGGRLPIDGSAGTMEVDGKIATLAFIKDITDRNQMEKALRESQEDLSHAQAVTQIGSWKLDLQRDKITCSDETYRIFDFPSGTPMTYKKFLSCVHPEDREYVHNKWKAALHSGKYDVEYRIMVGNEIRWIHAKAELKLAQGGICISHFGTVQDITEHKILEKSLRDSEHKYRTILEIAIDGFWINNEEGKLLEVNDSYCRMLGYTREELMAMNISDLEVVESPEEIHQHTKRVVEEGYDRFETQQRCKDGKVIDIEISANYIDFGEKLFFITVRDITERKKAETALRENEALFFSAFHQNPSAMVISSVSEGRIVDANDTFLRMLEYTREELIGKTAAELNIFKEPAKRDQIVQQFAGENRYKESEIEIYTKTGKPLTVISLVKGVSLNGQPHFICMGIDITERKQTEENYRQLIENMSDGYGVLIDGKFVFTNNRLCEIFGCEPEKMLQRSIYDFSVPESESENHQAAKEMFERITNGDREAPIWREGRAIREDGTEITLEIGSRVLPYEGKLGFYIIVRDVTERKSIEEERQKVDKLESVGTLAGGIAHDFNNLLTGIMGNISLVKRYVEQEGKAAERLNEAEKASVRAKDLTQQLLTFSRGGAPVKKLISLPDLIKEAATFILHGSKVKPTFSMEEDLWGIEADEGQISQVIHNIVKNASEAMPEGGIIAISAENVTIKSKTSLPLSPGKYVEIKISDTGIGIKKNNIDKIFDPYFTTKQEGSGLGLATSYSIIRKHGGHITMNSKLGEGTTVHIYLAASDKKASKKESRELQPKFTGQGRILVMDDEEIIRMVLRRILTDAGYEVEATGDGAEAIQAYIKAQEAGNPFDAVIMDLTIPGGMGGEEAIKRLIEIDPEVKAVVSSGYANDQVMSEYKDYGFSAVIVKPYNAREITEVIIELLKDKK